MGYGYNLCFAVGAPRKRFCLAKIVFSEVLDVAVFQKMSFFFRKLDFGVTYLERCFVTVVRIDHTEHFVFFGKNDPWILGSTQCLTGVLKAVFVFAGKSGPLIFWKP